MIEVKDLVKEYPGKRAVDGVSFSIGQGEIAGLLGRNGAGKSTVLNMITGYTAMTSGSVLVDGLDILEEPAAVRRRIGYLPEIPPLYVDMTVEEYLCFVYDLKKSKTSRKEDIRQACAAVDIADVKGRIIGHLSKGYRQRVGFAQALMGNPAVLIFDEPTVGLDPRQIMEIRRIIKALKKNHTIILSSHILSEVQSVCDRILVMDGGRLTADDRADRLSSRMSGADTIRVRVTGTEGEIRQELAAVAGVAAVQSAGQTEAGAWDFVVFTKVIEETEGVRLLMTKRLAEKGMYIIEMRRESMNLEDIFLKLTSGSDKPGEKPVKTTEKKQTKKQGVKPEAQAEKKPELKPKARVEKKPELKPEERAEKKPELKTEARAEKKPELKQKERAEKKPEKKNGNAVEETR